MKWGFLQPKLSNCEGCEQPKIRLNTQASPLTRIKVEVEVEIRTNKVDNGMLQILMDDIQSNLEYDGWNPTKVGAKVLPKQAFKSSSQLPSVSIKF